MEQLGKRHAWVGEVSHRIAGAAQSAPAGLELSRSDVERMLVCPGWWEATQTTYPIPPNIVDLHRSLIVDIAKGHV